MQRVILVVGFASALLVACSSSSSDEPKPTTCKRTDRAGIYRVAFTTQSGDCGDLPESLINLDAPDSTCKLASATYSNGDCKYSVDETCPVKGGTENHTVAVTEQQNADGSHLTGTFTVQLSGNVTCTGTYGVSAVRQ